MKGGTVVGSEDDDSVFEHALFFQHLKQQSEIMIEFGEAVAVNARAGSPDEVCARVHGSVRPRGGIIGEERLARIDGVPKPGADLVVDEDGVLPLVYVRAHGNFIVTRPQRSALADVVIRGVVVDMVRAVEIVKALIGGQILSVVAQVPLAERTRLISRPREHLRQRHFVAEHAVAVGAHLDGVEDARGVEGRERVHRGIEHVVGMSAVRITPRERGKARGGADGIIGIEVVERDAVFGDGINVGRFVRYGEL